MADEIKITASGSGMQDTGNPVLDTMLNFVATSKYHVKPEALPKIWEIIHELAKKEPGGLRRRGKDGTLIPSEDQSL